MVLGAQENKTILIDMDDVMTDLLTPWVEYLNDKHDLSVYTSDITAWDMSLFFHTLSKEEIYQPLDEEDFWKTVKPREGAVYYLNKLCNEYQVYIVTATSLSTIKYKIDHIIKPYFPFINPRNIIISNNKQMISGDILIDDNINNLLGGKYDKILFSRPHNYTYLSKDYPIIIADGWEDCYKKVHKILS